MVLFAKKTVVGWEEWVGLPDIGLPLVKAKIDTGAQTSCLHATNIKVVIRNGKRYAKFKITPVQKRKKIVVSCIAELVDRRYVMDSGGHREKRYVIATTMVLGKKRYPIEITLTDRRSMAFRMLLGRQAMSVAKLVVDPVKSHCMGKLTLEEVLHVYSKDAKLDMKQNPQPEQTDEKEQDENRDTGQQS